MYGLIDLFIYLLFQSLVCNSEKHFASKVFDQDLLVNEIELQNCKLTIKLSFLQP